MDLKPSKASSKSLFKRYLFKKTLANDLNPLDNILDLLEITLQTVQKGDISDTI